MMDILLAHGYFLSLDALEQKVMRPHPPLGLLYLSSHLKQYGFKAGVFDSTFKTIEDFSDALERERPPVVGFAVNLMTKRNVLKMIAIRILRITRSHTSTPAQTSSSLAKVSRRSKNCSACLAKALATAVR